MQLKLHKPTTVIGYSLSMCARYVDSTNPGRSNLVFRSKPIAEAEMSNRIIKPNSRASPIANQKGVGEDAETAGNHNPFIHSDHFYSASSSPLLLRSAPDTARILCRSFTPKRHMQL